MIETIFENLFKPVSDSELHARMEETFKLMAEYEEDLKPVWNSILQQIDLNVMYSGLSDHSPWWWQDFSAALRGELNPSNRMYDTVKLYKKWKAKQ